MRDVDWFRFLWLRVAPAGFVLVAVALVAVAGSLSLGVVAALALMALVAARPAAGAYVYLAVTPLVAGIDRNLSLPVLRLHEALLGLVIGGLVVRELVRMLAGHRYRLEPTRIDWAMFGLAVTASLVSSIWRFSQGLPIGVDDLLYAAVFWKYLALYAVFRVAVREPAQARVALWVALWTTAVVAILGILQALELFGVHQLLFRWYPPFSGETAEVGRGASTLALTFAVADICLICLGAAVSLARDEAGRGRRTALALAAVYLFGTVAAGQFSGFIGVGVAAVALGFLIGEMRTVLRFGPPAAVVAGAALWPVLAERFAGFQTRAGLPQSWSGRLDNLRTFILPELSNGWNLVFGVRPAARLPAPESWREWIFIESGYLWLLWSGGIPLLVAFGYFAIVCIKTLRRTALTHTLEVRAIATGAFVGLWVIVVLTVFDPHLTMRGVADLLFPLIAMAQVIRTVPIRRATISRQVAA